MAARIDDLPEVRGKYQANVPLARHTWFSVGGPAEVLFSPADTADLASFLKNKPNDIPIFVLGNGSNLLVRDGGIPGVVIKLDNFKSIKVDGAAAAIIAGAGTKNSLLKKTFVENAVGGLEFLCSIPGTLGGALRTNAGCYGGDIGSALASATIVDGNGNIKQAKPEDFHLSYRRSNFPEDWIITELTIKGEKSDPEKIKGIIESHREQREKTQPGNAKTAGSTFKNPEGHSAWKLVKEAGCADLRIGGARVSEKHANFLINDGSATAKDIEALGEEIVRRVFEKTGVTLEWEVRRIGNP